MLGLIVNADDLGYCPGVNKGIALGFQKGIVTSTTLLVNRIGSNEAIGRIKSGQIPAVGLHLCLTSSMPISPKEKIPSLVDQRGYFKTREWIVSSQLPVGEISLELKSQIEQVLSQSISISHLDCHHHIFENQQVLEAVAKLALEYKLPVRSISQEMGQYLRERCIATPDYFIGSFYGQRATQEHLLAELDKAKGQLKGSGIVELMVHPGIVDHYLLANSSYTGERQQELELLTSESIKSSILDRGFQLTNFLIYK